ncbi:MAG: putative bifunctional diguanylate cyclase/phosphodiesterase [Acidimicrobiales bacterium]
MAPALQDALSGLFGALVHALPTPAVLALTDGTVLAANDAAVSSIDGLTEGWPLDDIPVGWTAHSLDPAHSFGLLLGPAISTSTATPRSDGSRPALPAAPVKGSPVTDADSDLGGVVPTEADAMDDVRDHLLRQFFGAEGVVFVVFFLDGRIVECNEEWTQVLGHERDTVEPLDVWSIVADDRQKVVPALRQQLEETGVATPSLRMQASDGSTRDLSWSFSLDEHHDMVFGIGRDITSQLRLTEELERLAYYDGLTGLANRANLVSRLDEHLAAGDDPAVLFCDLDRFKVVNDSLGHAAGDELLRQLGSRLQSVVRRSRDLVVRLGGDEFVVLLGHTTQRHAEAEARRILEVVERSFEVAGRSVRIGMSIGVTARRGRAVSAEVLLGEADTAAYFAKEQRRGAFAVYDEQLQAVADHRFSVEAGLLHALEDDRFEVHYQPVVALSTGSVVGAEALVRWRDVDGRLHLPGNFVAIAEEAGLIAEIGDRVLRRAVAHAADLTFQGRPISISVNATAGQISSPSFVSTVHQAVKSSGLDPRQLVLELTESAIVGDLDSTIPVLESLRSIGVRVAVDDFGTGYSSLSYLQQLPIDIVKIDRSFVSRLGSDSVADSVVAAVLTLCEALSLSVVVEGIETVEQSDIVQDLGVDLAQGFLLHRPMPFGDLREVLAAERGMAPID